jgi:glutathione synthase/RimK-type ligase-like ATP-grasp enzyme
MILILTEPGDEHADRVVALLKARGADFVRFHTEDFPARASLSIGYGPSGQMRSLLRVDERTIDLANVQSVWSRRPRPPVPHERIQDAAARKFVAEESLDFLRDLWHALDCLWLPGQPTEIRRGQYKAAQLRVAGELGFELPPTLVTNNPDEFLDFYRQHNGNIISKLAGFGFQDAVGNTFVRYTEVVPKRAVGYAAAIEYCPVILQAYVPKQLELRITVVGQHAFAAEIHSQETHHTRHDWRRYDFGQTPHAMHDLPPEIHERCVRLVQRMGLTYGAIDMILTPDGRYVFVEINPSGQYLWIEELTGLPISEAICDLLMAGQGVAA